MTAVAAPSAPGWAAIDAESRLAATVVVPVRNEADELGGLVAALEGQTAPRGSYVVIVGDDGSADDPASAVGEHAIVTSGPPLNSYAARNRAAALVRAPALAFCDADCRPDPTWLESGLASLERADIVAGLIRFVVPEHRTIWSLLDMDMHLDQARSVRVSRAATANLFVRRDVFDRLGGFDDSVPNTSDYDLVRRCVESGGRLVFEPSAVVWHPTRDGARSFLRKLWAVNRRYAERESRAGRVPHALRLRAWIPLLQPVRSRRRIGRSLRLDRTRLAENGVRPTAWEDAKALPLMYLVIPYLANCGQVYGWWTGRKSRTRP